MKIGPNAANDRRIALFHGLHGFEETIAEQGSVPSVRVLERLFLKLGRNPGFISLIKYGLV
jgi:hypothetical protein